MEITLRPSNPDEYLFLVEHYSYLVDQELGVVERASENQYVIDRLPHLICLVNVVGYLRGQDNVFMNSRPEGIPFQDALYTNEALFEKRLAAVIGRVRESGGEVALRTRLEQYLVNFRLDGSPR